MFNRHRKKMLIVTVLSCLTAVTILSFRPDQQEPKKLKNIKVFPADFTYQQVDHAMDEFKTDLGVKCGYCHAPSKDNPRKMDMASDANPKKDIARDMMRMTMEMNKKYIAAIPHADTTKVQLITCNTCHRGAGKPFGKVNNTPPPPPFEGAPPPPPPGQGK